MKFFFPDSHDHVDPSFDFVCETRSETRMVQHDDKYAHEMFREPPFNGLLVSKATVDGTNRTSGKYSLGQKRRLYSLGVRKFLHVEHAQLETMGDCGAFSYVKEAVPPYTTDEVIDFYEHCGFDYGVSIDHVILGFQPPNTTVSRSARTREAWKHRQEVTLEFARDFLRIHTSQKCAFTPVAVAQGWSVTSYAESVLALQKMGYKYVGIGGLASLRTEDIIAILAEVARVRSSGTRLHLFGITRLEHMRDFSNFGVASFDSTAPFRHAFKEDRDNYYGTNGARYLAIRVPQSDGNNRLSYLISSGRVSQEKARRLESECLYFLDDYDKDLKTLDDTLGKIVEYTVLYGEASSHIDGYRKVLTERPWKNCPCEICRDIGIHVVIFRGTERNKRRGFHNLYVFFKDLESCL